MPACSDDVFAEKQGMLGAMRSTASTPAAATSDTLSAATQAQHEQAGLVSKSSRTRMRFLLKFISWPCAEQSPLQEVHGKHGPKLWQIEKLEERAGREV